MSDNYSTIISSKAPYPVRIGTLLLYCEKFHAESSRAYSEKTTVSGNTFFSNTNKKALRITLEGRIYDKDVPMRSVLYANAMMKSDITFSFAYRDISFSGCLIQSFSVTDSGEDYIDVSITLITVQPVTSEV